MKMKNTSIFYYFEIKCRITEWKYECKLRENSVLMYTRIYIYIKSHPSI